MGAYKSDLKFKQDIKNMTNGEYEFLDHYMGSTSKIRCRHNVCGTVFPVAPYNFKRSKHHCPTCISARKQRGAGHSLGIVSSQGRIKAIVPVRCDKKHRFRLTPSDAKRFRDGKLECPICKKLEVLDPLYKHSLVDLSFEMGLGGILS